MYAVRTNFFKEVVGYGDLESRVRLVFTGACFGESGN